jgi:lantibiotic modifying enzyme
MAADPSSSLSLASTSVFSDRARTTLDRARTQFLLHLATPVLQHERALREGTFSFAESPAQAAWDEHVIAGYPLLAEALTTVSRNWQRADTALEDRFFQDFPGTPIEDLVPHCSDPHDGQQAVSIVSVSDGPRIVYKPRSLAMEQAFADLLEWANDRGFPWPIRRVRIRECDGYGWMEYVKPSPCRDTHEVDAFHARTGGLLCLLTLLRATDIHHENLIAFRDQPVVVDLETIGHPRNAPISFEQALLETGMLPTGEPLDFSALGATEAFDTPFRHRVPLRENVPTLHSELRPAALHIPAVMRGFAAMYECLLLHDAHAVLERFGGRRVREIRRSSNAYGLLLQQSRHPEFLRSSDDRRALFRRLRNVSENELIALEQFDVPCFTAPCDPAPILSAYESLSLSALPSLLSILRDALQRKRERNGR